jgi:hypothetical protein
LILPTGAFVESEAGLVHDMSTRWFLTVDASRFAPADMQDARNVPVERLRPSSGASQLLWKVVPLGFYLTVILCFF